MDTSFERDRLLHARQALLTIDALALRPDLDHAAQVVSDELIADKVDIFLYEPTSHSLQAMGSSQTPLAARQRALGLDRLPLVDGGLAVLVYQTGQSLLVGRAEQDPLELRGVVDALGIRAELVVPLTVAGTRRGVIQASSTVAEQFTVGDLLFLEALAGWVGEVAWRAELAEQATLTEYVARSSKQQTAVSRA
jgi:GAF domain-containing protein